MNCVSYRRVWRTLRLLGIAVAAGAMLVLSSSTVAAQRWGAGYGHRGHWQGGFPHHQPWGGYRGRYGGFGIGVGYAPWGYGFYGRGLSLSIGRYPLGYSRFRYGYYPFGGFHGGYPFHGYLPRYGSPLYGSPLYGAYRGGQRALNVNPVESVYLDSPADYRTGYRGDPAAAAQSGPVDAASELRPGMVLPDGSRVISVDPPSPAGSSADQQAVERPAFPLQDENDAEPDPPPEQLPAPEPLPADADAAELEI